MLSQQENLAGSGTPEVEATLNELRAAVEEFQQMDRASAPPLELTAEEFEHLKALGYVH